MNAKSKQAAHALVRARTSLLVGQPFYGCLALQLQPVEIQETDQFGGGIECKTMAVDGVHLYYWPEFVLSLKEQELVGVVAHEVSHCAYKHMSRRGTRDPLIWNYAGDYVINSDLLKAGFTLPVKRLHDAQYDGMSTEEVYERLLKNGVVIKIAAAGGQGDGKGNEPGDMDGSQCGIVLDAGKGRDKAEQEKADRDWEANVRVALNTARRANAGNLPGHLERLAQAISAPRVSWRDQTKRFIDNSMGRDYSWSRRNRRFAGGSLILPGFVPDRLRHLVMLIDVSGSIDEALMKEFVNEVGGALDDGVADKISVVYADIHVRHVDEYTPGDYVQAKVIAGGGTCFRDAFNWVKNNAPEASCVVYLTDLMTGDFGDEPDCPTLWGVYLPTSYYDQMSKKVPFGETIHVSTAIG